MMSFTNITDISKFLSAIISTHKYVYQWNKVPALLFPIKQAYQLGFIGTIYRKKKVVPYTAIGEVNLWENM